MGTHATTYKVNVEFVEKKSKTEITAAYTRFYVGVVSRVLRTSSIPTDRKNEILDKLIMKYR